MSTSTITVESAGTAAEGAGAAAEGAGAAARDVEVDCAGREVMVEGRGVLLGCLLSPEGLRDGSGALVEQVWAVLPKVGERVDRPGGPERVWLGVAASDRERYTAWMLVGQEVTETSHGVYGWDARVHVVGAVEGDAGAAVAALARSLTVAASETARWQRWREGLIADAVSEAESRDYCTEFDDFMERNGMPRRSREYRVTVGARLSVAVVVTAEDEAGAREAVGAGAVLEAVRDAEEYDLEVWTATDAEST